MTRKIMQMVFTIFLLSFWAVQGIAQKSAAWVSKPDGSVSCEPKSGIPLQVMAQELKKAKIHVLESKKGSDGKMHIQMCGAETGTLNMFFIPADEVVLAQKMGFVAMLNK